MLIHHLAVTALIVSLAGAEVAATNPTGAPPEPKASASEGKPPEPAASATASPPRPIGRGVPPEPPLLAAPVAPVVTEFALREFLVLPPVGKYGRVPFHQDPLELQLALGKFSAPTEGDTIEGIGGRSQRWTPATAGTEGQLKDRALRGGYAFCRFDSEGDKETVMLLVARGHSMVFVNGEPRIGDHYQYGWVRIPIRLRPGANEFLFHVGSGQLQAKLVRPGKPVLLHLDDMTLPDVVRGETNPVWGSVVVVNASTQPQNDLEIRCRQVAGGALSSKLGPMAPLSIRKVAFQLDGDASDEVSELAYELAIGRREKSGDWVAIDEAAISLPVVAQNAPQKRTFVSQIDGSVQYYAVQPGIETDRPLGVILSLHGANVQATNQAAQYAAKSWAHVVAPTNRRPFGFDWEDWGRVDAIEALDDARQQLACQPRRTYLTGHSMGGHGTWHLGVTYPDKFAAIGPSAGWYSFWSYGRMPSRSPDSPIDRMFVRGLTPSDTVKLQRNLADLGVYVLHGAEDDNVPVGQARFMRSQLGSFHRNFVYFEQPDARHWWGSQCCDWPAMMEFFRRHELPESKDVDQIDFSTASPAVSAENFWVRVEAQEEQLALSRVTIKRDLKKRSFDGTTQNVARLSLDVSDLEAPGSLRVTLDGQRLSGIRWPGLARRIWLVRRDGRWATSRQPSPKNKGPHRYGTFKEVFNHRAVLVYGTKGDEEENRWALAKARYDAEQFWYRGNGSLEVIPDTAFDSKAYQDRNVVLYGNVDTNGAWPVLLSTSPVRVRSGQINIGTRPELGKDLAILFVRPRPGTQNALVGAVSGTGIVGFRLTDRLRYFMSGVAYPDLTLFGSGVLSEGTGDVRAAGYFGLDWKVDSADIVWRDLAL